MMHKPIPPQSRLNELFEFDHDTGELTWKYRTDRDSHWNGHYAGKRAGAYAGGYVKIEFDGQKYVGHRIVWTLAYGSLARDIHIDHINGNGFDNRLENLRLATNSQNQFNRLGTEGRKYKGVYRARDKWKSEITIRGKRFYLGVFDTREEAAEAYNAKAREEHGEFVKPFSMKAA